MGGVRFFVNLALSDGCSKRWKIVMPDKHATARQYLEKCLEDKARWRQRQTKLTLAEKILIMDKLKEASALFAPLRAQQKKAMDQT
jgi:hypothetical protein